MTIRLRSRGKMSKKRTKLLETVIEDLDGERGPGGGHIEGVRRRTRTGPGKARKKSPSKTLVVKIPTGNKDIDNSKVIIKGNAAASNGPKETVTDTSDIQEKLAKSDANNNQEEAVNGYIQTPGQDSSNDTGKVSTEKSQDAVYGMFTRTNTERSLFSTDTNASGSVSFSDPAKKSSDTFLTLPKRPKSVGGWTKRELDLFLPRKTFFSVHDKTLEVAGLDTKSEEERNRTPDWRALLRMHTMDELHPPKNDKTEEKASFFVHKPDSDDEEGQTSLDTIETAVGSKDHASHSAKKVKAKKLAMQVNSDKEEYKPLLDYLKHIHENPDEYINMSKYTHKNTDHKHPDTMVRLGRAFRRGHHGAVRNNIFLHAIAGLKPKCADTATSSQRTIRGDNVGTKKATENITSSMTNISSDKTAAQDDTELEKLKKKAETLMHKMSTQHFMKAKELALRELGEEDLNISKWWIAFQSCHYLRIPKYFDGTA
ncbi:uncharacterized protein LOC128207730 [Mya arenaria]|uniref:uncharacterized protein LOC128207730 n=1 Tax=Mya arenaria TaxID=6604 RepID=UPI0022E856AD|nr:uncharacterized protein LOC128207730 [Mya arenaria]